MEYVCDEERFDVPVGLRFTSQNHVFPLELIDGHFHCFGSDMNNSAFLCKQQLGYKYIGRCVQADNPEYLL